ncbi:hypothetical protein B6D60_06910 [candidate division KSB1 bacterium 4484_87]|nr:MAG: hypothetical protein B6D60_06910 [candidate division KSB1 bacterium 4484_87]
MRKQQLPVGNPFYRKNGVQNFRQIGSGRYTTANFNRYRPIINDGLAETNSFEFAGAEKENNAHITVNKI